MKNGSSYHQRDRLGDPLFAESLFELSTATYSRRSCGGNITDQSALVRIRPQIFWRSQLNACNGMLITPLQASM